MTPHEAAQNVVWFVVLLFVVLGFGLWMSMRAEKKEYKDGLPK